MKIRKLKQKDIPYMLEWMHDYSVVENLQTDFLNKTYENCNDFIKQACQSDEANLHRAITDDNDEYMGTISLKHIMFGSAEFAITIRKVAMGKGYSKFGMAEMLNYGFEKLNLDFVYWCVSKENKRARRFYEKNDFLTFYPKQNVELLKIIQRNQYKSEQIEDYIWYKVQNICKF